MAFLISGNQLNLLVKPKLNILVKRILRTTKNYQYIPGSHSTVFIATPNLTVAQHLANNMVNDHVAACVNILPNIISIYNVDEKVHEQEECMLIVKTKTSKMSDISQFIQQNHPYKIPPITSFPIDQGHPKYLKWLGENVI